MMGMSKRLKAAATTTTTLGCFFLVAGASSSVAALEWFRAGASLCQVESDYQSQDFDDNTYDSAAVAGVITCPIYERTGLQHATLSTFNAYLYDGSGSSQATVTLCRRGYTQNSATCGAAAGTGNGTTGPVTLGLAQLDEVAWSNSTGYAYIRVVLASSGGHSFAGYLAQE
jgi:hypothetical protein